MKNKLVKDLMTSPAVTCDSSTTIKKAIEILKTNNIGFLPVTKSDTIIGVVTDRDILIRGIGTYKLNSKINKVMTSGEIHFVNTDTPIYSAAQLMGKYKIRRLVVLNDGKVVGVLTTKNLLQEPSLYKYIVQTYHENPTLPEYSMYINSNPHDSIKADDFRL